MIIVFIIQLMKNKKYPKLFVCGSVADCSDSDCPDSDCPDSDCPNLAPGLDPDISKILVTFTWNFLTQMCSTKLVHEALR
jgi:hypothetical protein